LSKENRRNSIVYLFNTKENTVIEIATTEANMKSPVYEIYFITYPARGGEIKKGTSIVLKIPRYSWRFSYGAIARSEFR